MTQDQFDKLEWWMNLHRVESVFIGPNVTFPPLMTIHEIGQSFNYKGRHFAVIDIGDGIATFNRSFTFFQGMILTIDEIMEMVNFIEKFKGNERILPCSDHYAIIKKDATIDIITKDLLRVPAKK